MERGLGREGKETTSFCSFTLPFASVETEMSCFHPLTRGGSGLGGGDV